MKWPTCSGKERRKASSAGFLFLVARKEWHKKATYQKMHQVQKGHIALYDTGHCPSTDCTEIVQGKQTPDQHRIPFLCACLFYNASFLLLCLIAFAPTFFCGDGWLTRWHKFFLRMPEGNCLNMGTDERKRGQTLFTLSSSFNVFII